MKYLPLLLLLFSTIPSIVNGQFVPEQRLTASDSISYTPFNNSQCIAVSGQVIHIVFTDRRDGAGEVFYKRSVDGGASWDPDRRLTADDNIFSGRATIAAWNDEVHIVWMDRRDGNNELYYKRSTNDGTTWSDDERLTMNASNSEYPSMSLEFQTLHLVWNDDRNGNDEIYYKRSVNGGLSWTPDTRLTNNAGDSFKPSVAASDTLVHVLWEDNRNGTSEIFYKHSRNGGNTWSNDTKLSNSASDCYSPCVSANGTIVFAGWDDNRTAATEIYTRRSTDGGSTWSAEVNQSASAGTSYNVHHAFAGTFMFMVWNEAIGGELEIDSRFSTDAGLTWNEDRPLTNDAGSSEQPFVAISGKDVHVVWQDDRDGNTELYYTRNPYGNPFDNNNFTAWGHGFGDVNNDAVYALQSDPFGNTYVAGGFSGTVDIDPGPGVHTLTSHGSTDVFVYKLDPAGNLLWATSVGGQEADIAFSMTLDDAYNVILTGSFHSLVDFDPGPGTVNIGALGQEDVFVLKLSKQGEFRWAKRLGGTDRDEARSIVTAHNGDVIVGGYFAGSGDFDPGPSTHMLTATGEEDMFITRLNAHGEFLWTKQIGGSGFDAIRSMTIDASDNFVATGYFANTADFDPGNGTQLKTSNGGSDYFVLQANGAGELVWVNTFGGADDEEGNGIAKDQQGNIFITGYFNNTIDFDPGASTMNLTAEGESDLFIQKLDNAGSLVWARRLGGEGEDEGRAIAAAHDHVFITGYFENTADVHPLLPVVELHASGNRDVLVQKLDAAEGLPVWQHQLGGTAEDIGYAIQPVAHGKVGIGGTYRGTGEFSPEIEQLIFNAKGATDGFMVLIRECEPSYASVEISVCDAFQLDADSLITESGTYTILAESASGCDSIITLTLTVFGSDSTAITDSACDAYTTPAGNIYTQSGTYTEALTGESGCDSIVIYTLDIRHSTQSSLEVSACESYTDPVGNVLTESGAYEYHLQNTEGCDSLVTILLSLGHPSTQTFGVEACDFFAEGDSIWYQSGFYTYTYITEAGCDSVLRFDVYVYNFDTTVMETDSGLLAVNGIPGYTIWVDCNNGFTPVPGESGNLFTPEISGSYAALIGDGACYDTSACHTVVVVGQHEPGALKEVSVSPNPTSGQVSVKLPAITGEAVLVLYDPAGKIVAPAMRANGNEFTFTMDVPTGMYFLLLKTEGWRRVVKVVKL